jgi:hypothetical protein
LRRATAQGRTRRLYFSPDSFYFLNSTLSCDDNVENLDPTPFSLVYLFRLDFFWLTCFGAIRKRCIDRSMEYDDLCARRVRRSKTFDFGALERGKEQYGKDEFRDLFGGDADRATSTLQAIGVILFDHKKWCFRVAKLHGSVLDVYATRARRRGKYSGSASVEQPTFSGSA